MKIVSSKKSGKVIIARLKDGDTKKRIMENKHKLKEENIYIENDLTWKRKKIQEKINKWAKEERVKGKEVKVGYTKVRINRI